MTQLQTVAWLILLFAMPGILQAQTPPTLIIPERNIVTSSTSVSFEWNLVSTAINYHIQISESSSFSPVLQEDQNVSVPSFSATLASGKKYYWRVRANTGNGYTSWSSVWSFRIFSPSNINVATWYKADYGIQLDANGLIYQWDDASGNGNHAVQSNTSFRPLFVASAQQINDKPVIRFDGVNDYVLFTTYLTSIETVFWVIKEDADATNKYRPLLGDYNSSPDFHRGCCDGGFPGPTRYIFDDQYAAAAVRNGTTRINGTIVPALSTNVPTSMSIISTKTSANTKAGAFTVDRPVQLNEYRVWDGDLAELIIFNDPLSDSLISLVTEYLGYKYAPPVNLGADRIENYKLCNTVNMSLGYYKSYTWSTGANTSSIQVTTPGTYWVSVTDQFNRISRDTVEVQFVRPNIIQPASICMGDSIVWDTGLGNSYNFQWQDGNAGSSYVIRGEGNYWVKVTDSTGCVYQTPSVHISVDSFAAIADLGPDTVICQGQSIGLISGAELTTDYEWNTGETEPTISITTTGVYHVTVHDSYGCQKIDSIYVSTGANAPNSNFNGTNVCSGSITQFTDQTTISQPNNVVSWYWKFGDSSTDSIPNPTHFYNSPGTYSVTLTTTADNLCINSKTKMVKVYSLPQPLFHDSVACVNKLHHFEDASTVEQGATIATWFWNFGDNSAAIQQNPIHQYYTTDTFDVSLTVTDSRGCNNVFHRSVESIPSPSLPTPANLLFPTNNVTISDPRIIFDWQPSEQALHYSLQISTNPGFTNIIHNIQEIFVDSMIVDDLALGSTYYWRVLSFNMCGDYSLTSVSNFKLFKPSVLPGLCLWLSSDRGISTDINEAVQEWQDNSSSSNDAGQANSLRRPQFVEHISRLNNAPVVRFDGTDDYVQFRMIDSIRTAFWLVKEDSNATPFYRHLLGNSVSQPDFHRGCCDDGFPGTKKYIFDNDYAATSVITGITRLNGKVIDPLQTDAPKNYSILTTKTSSYTKGDCFSCDRPLLTPNEKRYWDGDLAELILFCQPLSDSLINAVESYLKDKYAPPVNLGPDIVLNYGFCAPTILNAGDRFVSYLWSTGETTASIHANGPGTYWVQAKDIFGDTSYDEVVITGGLNVVTFSDTLNICMGDSVTWDTQLGYDYSFHWQDGSDKNYFILSDTGKYWVTVNDSFNCSITTDTVVIRIDSFSVQASLGPDTNLCSGNRIGLLAGNDAPISYLWNNGSAESTVLVDQSADYSLTVRNSNNCVAYDTVHVNVMGVAPHADFSFEGICLNDTTEFSDLSTPSNIVSWTWKFGNGNSATSQNPEYLYQTHGTYDVKLTVTDSIGCSQWITKPVTIYPLPIANFYHDLVNCATDEVHFHDTSTVATGQTINSWSWTLGDGDFVTQKNTVHVYEEQGLYPVSIKVTTNKGCSNMTYKPVEIFPELKAAIKAENLCFDYPTNFFDNSPGFSNVSWYWDFGNHLGYSFKKNPTYNFLNPGTYIVTLKVVNAIGCDRTVMDTITITSHPTVDFDDPILCEKTSFHFTDKTITNGGDKVINWQWNFGDQSEQSSVVNPVHSYRIAGLYDVSLDVQTENGCISSATKTITVIQPPTADFTFSPTYGAAPITIHFTNLSEDGSSYEWNFGDDAVSSELNPSHTYQNNDTVNISLVSSNLPGCNDTAMKPFIIAVATVDLNLIHVTIEKSYNDDCSYFVKMTADIQNVGTRDVTSFDILASNSNGGNIVEHWTGAFHNRQLTYHFNADFLISDCEENVVICVEVMNPNGEEDQSPTNNRSCVTLSSEPVIIGPYPNPANDYVNLDIILPTKGNLKIYNFNAMGNKLGMMTDGQREKGYHRISMETRDFSPGVYMLKIEFNGEVYTAKYLIR